MAIQNADETGGSHIWLRYAKEYTKDGQKYTIEIGVPVPIGASMERREQLISEAQAGMEQLVSHVERRWPQQAQVGQQGRGGQDGRNSQGAQAPLNQVQEPKARPIPPEKPMNRPATVAAAQTTPQPLEGPAREVHVVKETRAEVGTTRGGEVTVPPTRPTIGASMPMTIGPALDSSGNLSLSEFIQYIQQNMGLTPKEAMKVLNVKSLSGINLREALERLRYAAPAGGSGEGIGGAERRAEVEQAVRREASTPRSSGPLVQGVQPQVEEDERTHGAEVIEMRVNNQVRGFDEEVGPEEDELDDLEELEPESSFTPQQLEQARAKIRTLRESQGATVASPQRMQALHNVVDSQISEDQLQALITGIWNIPMVRKLKIDQVQALIEWGKEDYFVEEVEAVLAVLEEEHYARGNR